MSAEQDYRNAFERLKMGVPQVLGKGSLVSQNNVAREAGADPSALKKSRFPILVAEIQEYIKDKLDSNLDPKKNASLIQKKKKRSLEEELSDSKNQRDRLASQLLEADMTILELREKLADASRKITPTNIKKINDRGPL